MKQLFTFVILLNATIFCATSHAQHSKLDLLFAGADTTGVIDSLLKDFDAYLDSLSIRTSFFNISAGVGTGYFSFRDNTALNINTVRQALFSPQVNYFHKSGLGLSATGFLISENGKLNPYQFAISPSYDYVKPAHISAGISYTRYFNRKDLSFYTTPIRNELYTYFNYRKWWLEPGIAVGYGWGSKTEYTKQEVEIYRKRLKHSKTNTIYIRQDESVKDLSLLVSVRHTFNWYNILDKKDFFSVTPAFLLSAGTQNFGLNTSFSSNSKYLNNNVLPANSNIKDTHGRIILPVSSIFHHRYCSTIIYLPQTTG
jgi:hypothetical protein